MHSDKFFEKRTDQSEIKARIVQKYFGVWAKIVTPTAMRGEGRIAYIDLYAGPGRYEDGTASTPLLVLQQAIADPKMCKMLVTLFNDSNKSNTERLQSEINKLPGIEKLKHKPKVTCGKIDEDIAEYFNKINLIPSFSFLDPFGYIGLTLKIINGVIKNWGCDCLLFFNYNRINPGISNPIVDDHMDALFGKARAEKLRNRLQDPNLTPEIREALVLENFTAAIKEMGGEFVLPFLFKRASGKRTSHGLVFVSKSFKGYDVMKGIMAKESSTYDQGVPSFVYSPVDASMPLLFSLQQPLDRLKQTLPVDFAGQELTVDEIYKRHSVDKPYMLRNYREILMQLEDEGIITATSAKGKRIKGKFPGHLLVRFPDRSGNGE